MSVLVWQNFPGSPSCTFQTWAMSNKYSEYINELFGFRRLRSLSPRSSGRFNNLRLSLFLLSTALNHLASRGLDVLFSTVQRDTWMHIVNRDALSTCCKTYRSWYIHLTHSRCVTGVCFTQFVVVLAMDLAIVWSCRDNSSMQIISKFAHFLKTGTVESTFLQWQCGLEFVASAAMGRADTTAIWSDLVLRSRPLRAGCHSTAHHTLWVCNLPLVNLTQEMPTHTETSWSVFLSNSALTSPLSGLGDDCGNLNSLVFAFDDCQAAAEQRNPRLVTTCGTSPCVIWGRPLEFCVSTLHKSQRTSWERGTLFGKAKSTANIFLIPELLVPNAAQKTEVLIKIMEFPSVKKTHQSVSWRAKSNL